MEFTNEFIKKFSKTKYNTLDRDELLTIKGVNYLGQKFETIGNPMGNGYVDTDAIGIYLGQHRLSQTNNRNYVTFFNAYREGSKSLYVLEIEQNGQVIYKNQDAQEIIAKTTAQAKNLYAFTTELNEAETQLQNLVARPALIQGAEPFAVKSVQKVKLTGNYKIEGTNGTFETSHIIKDTNQIKLDKAAIAIINQNEEEFEA